MSSFSEREFRSELIDLHLGRLTDTEREQLESRLRGVSDSSDGSELREEHAALEEVFGALQTVRDATPAVPADLKAKIAARVAAAGDSLRIHPARQTAAVAEDPGFRAARLHSFRDIASIAAMVVLAVGLGVPSVLHMRERSERIACSANLAQLGRGVQQYATAFNGQLPFAGWGGDYSWRPTDKPGVKVLPNRRHVYPLARLHHVPTIAFICPSANGVPMPSEQVARRDDFIESRNVSYAYQNMAGVRPVLRENPDLPILADDNPLFDDGRPLFAAIRQIGLRDPARTNSRAHGGAGQNILTVGGEVKWLISPMVGPDGDNIWTLEGVGEYTGREGPETPRDAHLLK